jgi:transcriptional regulator with XRE-family HTH domain
VDRHGPIGLEIGAIGPAEEGAEALGGVEGHSDLNQDRAVRELTVAHFAVEADQSFRHGSSAMMSEGCHGRDKHRGDRRSPASRWLGSAARTDGSARAASGIRRDQFWGPRAGSWRARLEYAQVSGGVYRGVMYYNNYMTPTAELVRTMKLNSGHTLRELARRAKTSAPALVDYEAGRHEPKLSTLQRIADAAGCDLIVEVRPRLTHPERRTLELHKLVAEKLRADPQNVIQRAKARIDVMRSRDPEGRSASYINTWDRLLSGSIDELEAAMTSTDQASRDLRQSSPSVARCRTKNDWTS